MFNTQTPVEVTPEEYEKQVARWLNLAAQTPVDLKVEPLKTLTGSGGDYEIDAVATLSVLGGAVITIVVECKRYTRKVE